MAWWTPRPPSARGGASLLMTRRAPRARERPREKSAPESPPRKTRKCGSLLCLLLSQSKPCVA